VSLKWLSGIFVALILVPLGLVINALVLVVLTLAGLFGKLVKGKPQLPQGVEKLEASIVIPSWNAKDLLATCLPPLQKAVEFTGGNHEIIVVDNGSVDGSAQFVRENFPQVKVVISETNLGFGKASNMGIRAAAKDIVVLLNNDMIVEEDFLSPLLQEFKDKPDLFGATAQIFFWDKEKRREETGKTGAYIRHGSIYAWHEADFTGDGPFPVTYAGGGSTAYDRKKLLELGGFDELYHPFYVEDLDLSFMAWKRGWRIVFKPESVVYHKHRGTIGSRFSQTYIQSIIRKNEIVFVWKNISSFKNLCEHFSWLWLRLLSQTARGTYGFTLAYFRALSQLGMVIKRRVHENKVAAISDNQVFSRSTSQSAYREAFGPQKVVDTQKPLKVLFVCPYIPYPPTHGGAVRMYNLIKQLAKDHEVYLLSFVEDKKEFSSFDHLSEFCKEVKLILRKASWRNNSVLWLRPQSSLDEFYSSEFENTLQKMVDKYDIDIVQYEYTQMAQYIKSFPRAKNVLTEHDVTFVTRYRYFRSIPMSWEKIRAFMRWATMFVWELEVCRKFDLVCSVSTKEKELLLSYDDRLQVSDAAPTGTDTNFYNPGLRTAVEPNSLLFVGFFRHTPNVEGIMYFLREVYPLIKQRRPDVKLYIVGSSPPAEVVEYKRDPSIIVTGFVDDLRDYYAKGQVFVVPILRGAGVRVKIYEAMAAGIPIVSTGLGAEGIEVSDGKDIYLADTPEEFAEKTISLLADQPLQLEMAKQARKLVVENYEWASITKRLVDEYYELWRGQNV
jgi:O-antigen biosynthesis protein